MRLQDAIWVNLIATRCSWVDTYYRITGCSRIRDLLVHARHKGDARDNYGQSCANSSGSGRGDSIDCLSRVVCCGSCACKQSGPSPVGAEQQVGSLLLSRGERLGRLAATPTMRSPRARGRTSTSPGSETRA